MEDQSAPCRPCRPCPPGCLQAGNKRKIGGLLDFIHGEKEKAKHCEYRTGNLSGVINLKMKRRVCPISIFWCFLASDAKVKETKSYVSK